MLLEDAFLPDSVLMEARKIRVVLSFMFSSVLVSRAPEALAFRDIFFTNLVWVCNFLACSFQLTT